MHPVAQVVALDGSVAVGVLVVLGLLVIVLVAVGVRSARRRRAAYEAALARSRDEVEQLSRKVEQLSDEVLQTRRDTDADREYVITTLGNGVATTDEPSPEASPAAPSQVTKLVEDRLVGVLTRQPLSSPLRARGVQLAVRAVALGHGLRRALSPDVLDRAAAESHVARRRSRRDRRRQVRAARRLVARDQHQQDVA